MKKLTFFMLLLFLVVGAENTVAQNNCLDFAGATETVISTGKMNLDGMPYITLEAWIYIKSFQSTSPYISSICGIETASGRLLLRLAAGNKVQFVLVVDGTERICESTQQLALNTWYHVAGTYSFLPAPPPNVMTIDYNIYINGLLDKNVNEYVVNGLTANDYFYIGSNIYGHQFDGKIDEVRVWVNKKTEAEIRANMYKELAGTGLVAYYKLNAASGTTAVNVEGTIAYDCTLSNMTDSDWQTSAAFAGPKNCLNFDGGLQASTADYASKSSNISDSVDNFTIMAWAKPDVVTNGSVWRCIAYNGDDGGGWGIGIKDSKVTGLFGTVLWAVTSEVLTIGTWYHITMRRSGGTVQFFLNGELLAYSSTSAPLIPNAKFTIGNMYDNTGLALYTDSFDGQIDEVRVYDIALTDQQIRENMCNTLVGDETNLVAYYNFDNSVGTTLQSFDGSTPILTNDLTLVNMSNVDWVTSTAFNTWLNVTNTTYSTTTNWSSGSVPSSTDNVGIQSYTGGSYPTCDGTVASPSLCNNISVAPSATFDIGTSKALTVSGNLSNYGTFTINSDATGTGSLIVNGTATGSIVQERYIGAATWGTWDDGWHFLSSPVANYAIQGNFTVATATDYDFYAWSEPNNLWINFKPGDTPSFLTVNGSTNFELGHGYMAAYAVAATKNFTGTINLADVTIIGLTNTGGTTDFHSWHLLGNPFNSALTWDNTWTTTNIGANIQIWNEAGRSYTVIANNPGGIIPATNGFMIQGTDATTASVTIPASKRVHSTQAFYKGVNFPIIKLKANNIDNPSFQESQLLFNPESTTGYEPEYDCDFLAGYAPLFYSTIENRPMALNNMPNVEETTNIPFTFIKNEGLNFSIEMYEVENMELDVWLFDNKINKDHNLTQNPVYYFTAFENDSPERFNIHFSPLGVDEPTTQTQIVQIWASNSTINIFNNENLAGDVKVLNMFGQVILKTQLNGDNNQQLIINTPSGYYIVNIVTKKGVVNKKLYIR